MFKPLLSEILDQIDIYLFGASSDRQLEGWIVANLQRILDSGDTEAIRLADEVDASFIEVGEGIIDQTILHRRFDDLVRDARPIPFESVAPDERMLTVSEVASLLHVHPNTVRRWADVGLLPGYRIGARGARRFKSGDIASFLVTWPSARRFKSGDIASFLATWPSH